MPEREEEWETISWIPYSIIDHDLMMYLRAARSMAAYAGMCNGGSTEEGFIAASLDETTANALTTLHNNDYDTAKALQALVRCPVPISVEKKWNEEESKRFVRGLRQYGKNFFKIRKELLSHKDTADLVEYYYNWKKTAAAVGVRPHRRNRRPGLKKQTAEAEAEGNSNERPASNEADLSSASEDSDQDSDDSDAASYACSQCAAKSSKIWHHARTLDTMLCTECHVDCQDMPGCVVDDRSADSLGRLKSESPTRQRSSFLFKPVKDDDSYQGPEDAIMRTRPSETELDSEKEQVVPQEDSDNEDRSNQNGRERQTSNSEDSSSSSSDSGSVSGQDDVIQDLKQENDVTNDVTNHLVTSSLTSTIVTSTVTSQSDRKSPVPITIKPEPTEPPKLDYPPPGGSLPIMPMPLPMGHPLSVPFRSMPPLLDSKLDSSLPHVLPHKDDATPAFMPYAPPKPNLPPPPPLITQQRSKSRSPSPSNKPTRSSPCSSPELTRTPSPGPEPTVVNKEHHKSASAIFMKILCRGSSNSCARCDLVFKPLPESKLARKREERLKRQAGELRQTPRDEKMAKKAETPPPNSTADAQITSALGAHATPPFAERHTPRAQFPGHDTPALRQLSEYARPHAMGQDPRTGHPLHPSMDPLLHYRMAGMYPPGSRERLELELERDKRERDAREREIRERELRELELREKMKAELEMKPPGFDRLPPGAQVDPHWLELQRRYGALPAHLAPPGVSPHLPGVYPPTSLASDLLARERERIERMDAGMRSEQQHLQELAGRNISLYHLFAQRYSNLYQHYAQQGAPPGGSTPYKNLDGRLLDPSHLAYQFSRADPMAAASSGMGPPGGQPSPHPLAQLPAGHPYAHPLFAAAGREREMMHPELLAAAAAGRAYDPAIAHQLSAQAAQHEAIQRQLAMERERITGGLPPPPGPPHGPPHGP